MKKIKVASMFMVAVIGTAAIVPVVSTESYAADSAISVAEHTPQEIRQYIDYHPSDTSYYDGFAVQPSTSYPYSAGRPDDKALNNALNYLNCVRYIAGLQEVSLNSEYSNLAQHAALVDCVNGVLTHFPEQPSDMPDDMYQLGAKGAGSSNICAGSSNLARSVMLYMDDSDFSNIDRVGHRRWCLNPGMKETGFGIVGRYSAMYAFDSKRTDATEKGVCWPAQNMPVEYFKPSVAWSVSTGEDLDYYNNITVNVTRKSDSAEWNFSKTSSDGDFYIENNYYGQRGCIIFRPSDISISANDVYDVRIEGMEEPIEYTVNFFSLADVQDESGENLIGDVNNDGFVDADDATAVLVEYSLLSTNQSGSFSELQKKSADINSDGFTDADDATKILEYYAYVSTNSDNISMKEWLLL